MPLEPGTALGSYETLEPVGSGGMGDVFRARDLELSGQVAIKVLRQEGLKPDLLRRFEHEARAASAVNHPANVLMDAVTVKDLEGDREGALLALDEALRAGYSLDEVQRDPELTDLLDDFRHREPAPVPSR